MATGRPLPPDQASPARGEVELAAAAAVLIRRAILTLSALPDRDLRHLGRIGGTLPPVAMSLAERQAEWGVDAALAAQQEESERRGRQARRFRPRPADVSRCLEVWRWLTWLKSEPDGARDLELLVRRAHGVPVWRLAERFGRSDDTIYRWHSVAVLKIVNRFAAELAAMAGDGGGQ